VGGMVMPSAPAVLRLMTLILCRLLHRQDGGLLTSEDTIDVVAQADAGASCAPRFFRSSDIFASPAALRCDNAPGPLIAVTGCVVRRPLSARISWSRSARSRAARGLRHRRPVRGL
jgi:hypothetical protein